VASGALQGFSADEATKKQKENLHLNNHRNCLSRWESEIEGKTTSRSQQHPDPSKFKEKQDQERRQTPSQNAAISRAVNHLRRDVAAFKKTRSIILCRTGNRWPSEASSKYYRQRYCSTSFEEPFG
jgi:hypothetical protein